MNKVLKCPNCNSKIEFDNNEDNIVKCNNCNKEYKLNSSIDKYGKEKIDLNEFNENNKLKYLLVILISLIIIIVLVILLINLLNKTESFDNDRETYAEQVKIKVDSIEMWETPDDQTVNGYVYKNEIYTNIYYYNDTENNRDYYYVCNTKEESECGYILGRDNDTNYVEVLEYTEPSYVEDIDANKYFELYNSSEPVIVLLSRPGCIHCVHYKPILFRLSDDYKIKIYSLNTNTIDNETDFNKVWELADASGTPTTVIFQNGKIVDKLEGTYSREELIEFFTNHNFITK